MGSGGVSRSGTRVPVFVRACMCQCGGTCYQCRMLASVPGSLSGSGCWRSLEPLGVGRPWWPGYPASRRSKCLDTFPSPSQAGPGSLGSCLRGEGPGWCVPGRDREWGPRGWPGPRAGRGLGGPARLTSGDSLNRAGSALGPAFLEEPERGRRPAPPSGPPARTAAPPPSVRGAAARGSGMGLRALGALLTRRT